MFTSASNIADAETPFRIVDQENIDPQQYLAILKRRKWQFIIPALILFVVSVAFAMMWPPTYQASALILIEEPDVPRDLVQSTVSSYAADGVINGPGHPAREHGRTLCGGGEGGLGLLLPRRHDQKLTGL